MGGPETTEAIRQASDCVWPSNKLPVKTKFIGQGRNWQRSWGILPGPRAHSRTPFAAERFLTPWARPDIRRSASPQLTRDLIRFRSTVAAVELFDLRFQRAQPAVWSTRQPLSSRARIKSWPSLLTGAEGAASGSALTASFDSPPILPPWALKERVGTVVSDKMD